MSPLAALDRAQTIWGGILTVNAFGDKFVISTKLAIAGDTEHMLDENGHAVCHPLCSRMEEAAGRS